MQRDFATINLNLWLLILFGGILLNMLHIRSFFVIVFRVFLPNCKAALITNNFSL